MTKSWICIVLAALALFVGCGENGSQSERTSDTTPGASPAAEATSTSEADEEPAGPAEQADAPAGSIERPLSDRTLIRDLWFGFSEAWQGGTDGAEQFLEENNYPPYQKDSDLCRKSDEERGIQRKEFAYDEDTIKLEEDWTIPEGSLKGQKPSGTIYSMRVRQRVLTDEGRASVEGTSHVLIDDGKAYLFLDCARIASAD